MALPDDFTLVSCAQLLGAGPPVPADTIKLDVETTSLVYSSSYPGGYNAISVGLRDDLEPGERRPWLEQRLELPEWGHVEVWSQGLKCAEGRVSLPDYPAGKLRGFDCQGYHWALSDDVFINPGVADTTAAALFLFAIGNAGAVSFNLGGGARIQAPTIETNLAQLSGQTPAQVLEQLCKAGDAAEFLWDYAIWNERAVDFLPRVCPKDAAGRWAPDYEIDWGDPVLEVRPDYTSCYGSVYVVYTDVAGGGEQTIGPYSEPSFSTRFGGFTRTGRIAVGTTTKAIAAAIGQVWVYNHAWPTLRGTITLGGGRGLAKWPLGDRKPPQFVRAGEYVQLGGKDYPPQVIVRAETDVFRNTTTLELGAPAAGYPQLISELRNIAEHSKQGRNALSGAAV